MHKWLKKRRFSHQSVALCDDRVLGETCAQKNIALYSSCEIFFMTNDGNKHNDVSRQALDNKHKENSREGKEQGRFARTGRHCLQQLLHLSSADRLTSAPQRRQPVRSGVISPQRRETYLTPCTKTAAGSSTFWISQMIDETASRQLHGVCSLCLSRACLGKLPFHSNAFEKDQNRSENGAQKNAFSFEQQWNKTHTVDLSRAGALRPAIWRLAAAYLHKTSSFLVLSLCLSRACLGKVIIFRKQSGEKDGFSLPCYDSSP
jgi:hypothetical protein